MHIYKGIKKRQKQGKIGSLTVHGKGTKRLKRADSVSCKINWEPQIREVITFPHYQNKYQTKVYLNT